MDELLSARGDNIDQEEVILDWVAPDSAVPSPDPQIEFWGDFREIERVTITVRPPEKPLSMLEKLGPSPFERGSFPLIGFLATTFDKVSQFALERAGHAPLPDASAPPTDISIA